MNLLKIMVTDIDFNSDADINSDGTRIYCGEMTLWFDSL